MVVQLIKKLKLKLSKNYINEIEEYPPNLSYLDIGENYNYPLVNLPFTLETLIISGIFNSVINYPINLKYLIIKIKNLKS